jgi:transcriptional regulator with XRE-family HTH domain
MARNWNELRTQMTPEQRARAAAKAEGMLVQLQLSELRRARSKTQVEVAQAMETQQAAISKLERREDMYLSTLREYVEALGGELKMVASFPDAEIPIQPLPPASR